MVATVLELLFWPAFFVGGVWLLNYLTKVRYLTGELTGKSGTGYLYVIGDRLHYGYANGQFNGIDIVLSATLPNIYLDGKVHEGSQGPRHYMAKNQRLELEGDFGKYFICYVPKDYQVLALSLLTPDVMETLRREVPDCDVEIYRGHVRIIVRHRVYGKPEATAALLRAADKVLQEVDHKLQSWSQADSQAAGEAVLVSEDNPTIKIFGKGLRLTTIVLGSIYGLLALLIWLIVLNNTKWPAHVTIGWLVGNFWPGVLFFPVLWLLLVVGVPRGWFNWLWRLMFDRRRV